MTHQPTNPLHKEIVEEFKNELETVLDRYFPKIEEEGAEKKANKRGEALMLVAAALTEMTKALTRVEEEAERRGRNAAVDIIRHILPMAKGYAAEHDVGRNYEITCEAEAFLATTRTPANPTN